jgi:hypothetical protein
MSEPLPNISSVNPCGQSQVTHHWLPLPLVAPTCPRGEKPAKLPGRVKLETDLPEGHEAAGQVSHPQACSLGAGGGARQHGLSCLLRLLPAPRSHPIPFPFPFVMASPPSASFSA